MSYGAFELSVAAIDEVAGVIVDEHIGFELLVFKRGLAVELVGYLRDAEQQRGIDLCLPPAAVMVPGTGEPTTSPMPSA